MLSDMQHNLVKNVFQKKVVRIAFCCVFVDKDQKTKQISNNTSSKFFVVEFVNKARTFSYIVPLSEIMKFYEKPCCSQKCLWDWSPFELSQQVEETRPFSVTGTILSLFFWIFVVKKTQISSILQLLQNESGNTKIKEKKYHLKVKEKSVCAIAFAKLWGISYKTLQTCALGKIELKKREKKVCYFTVWKHK